MALINCPECNKQISDKATICPNCGNPIAPITNNMQQPKIIVKRSEGIFMRTLNLGCLIVILFIGLFIFFAFFSNIFFDDFSKKLEKQRIERLKEKK